MRPNPLIPTRTVTMLSSLSATNTGRTAVRLNCRSSAPPPYRPLPSPRSPRAGEQPGCSAPPRITRRACQG
jgi:hypothetical protein